MKPVEPPGFAHLLRTSVVVWWVLVVVGVIVIVLSAYLYLSGRMKVDARVPSVAVLVAVFGAFCVYMAH